MDDQARKDAFADADTLLTVLSPPWSNVEWRTLDAAEEAESIGLGHDFKGLWPDVAGYLGRTAARAAFRACPGLRG